mgnify:CR=1 FL=1
MKNLTWVPNFNRNSHLLDYALYLQDQIAIGSQWKWRGGLRWDHFDSYDKDRVAQYEHQLYNDKFSWNVGLAYQPIPQTSFYGGILEEPSLHPHQRSRHGRRPRAGERPPVRAGQPLAVPQRDDSRTSPPNGW